LLVTAIVLWGGVTILRDQSDTKAS
jgi:hypothetical protein